MSPKSFFNSIKREQSYCEFKLDVYRQETEKQETDLVPEVTPPEVGHLKLKIMIFIQFHQEGTEIS